MFAFESFSEFTYVYIPLYIYIYTVDFVDFMLWYIMGTSNLSFDRDQPLSELDLGCDCAVHDR